MKQRAESFSDVLIRCRHFVRLRWAARAVLVHFESVEEAFVLERLLFVHCERRAKLKPEENRERLLIYSADDGRIRTVAEDPFLEDCLPHSGCLGSSVHDDGQIEQPINKFGAKCTLAYQFAGDLSRANVIDERRFAANALTETRLPFCPSGSSSRPPAAECAAPSRSGLSPGSESL